MQKFGLQRTSSTNLSAIELEIVKEQASALGRAGKKLRLALERYNSSQVNNRETNTVDQAQLAEISACVWELTLQREFLGFVEGNLEWIRARYHIPDEAMQSIGTCQSRHEYK